MFFRLSFVQDGAPCHCTRRNITYLENQFNGRLISRKCVRGRPWPPRSPDLNILDFAIWGILKDKVFTPRPATLQQLEANIRREVAALDPQMLRRCFMDVRARAHICIQNNGGHVEG